MVQPKQFTLILLFDKLSHSLQISQSLREKDIEVTIAQNASDVIQHIALKKVDMVGLSVNHSSSSSVIQVLREKTNIPVIAFGEDKLSSTNDKVDKIGADYKIAGVVSSYNIWMRISHIVKSRQKEIENSGAVLYSDRKKSRGEQESFMIKQKQNQEDMGSVISLNQREGDKKIKLPKKEGTAHKMGSVLVESTGEAPIGKIKLKKEKIKVLEEEDIQFIKGGNESSSAVELVKEKASPAPVPPAKIGLGLPQTAGLSKPKLGLGKRTPEKKMKVAPVKTEEELLDEEIGAIENMINAAITVQSAAPAVAPLPLEVVGAVATPMEDLAMTGQVELKEVTKEPKKVVSLSAFKKKKLKKDVDVERDQQVPTEREDNEAAAIAEVPRKSLQEGVLAAGIKSYQKEGQDEGVFGTVNRLIVIPVDYLKDRGFLLVCTSDNSFVSSERIEKLREQLNLEMDSTSPQSHFNLGEAYQIQTHEVDISSWASQQEEFSFYFNDGGSKQVFVGFLRRDHIYPDVIRKSEFGVYQADLDIIPPMMPVSFNVFILLTKNRRLIPYLRRGGKFSGKQIERLHRRGFKSIYINEEDKKEFFCFFITLALHQDLGPRPQEVAA